MEVCAPRDAFVINLFVSDHDQVKIGSPLLQLDTDVEDRHAEHVQKMEASRIVWEAQYTGSQLDLLREIAKLAVDIANEKVKQAKINYDWEKALVMAGVPTSGNYLGVRKSEYDQSLLEVTKAEAQQKQLEYAVTRHAETSALVKKMNNDQLEFIAKRKGRLSIAAPSTGQIKLRVAEGSFAKRGSVLMEIG